MSGKRIVFGLILLSALVCVQQATAEASFPDGYNVSVVHSDENGILIDIVVTSYELEKIGMQGGEYWRLTIPGAGTSSQPGFPSVPKISKLIGVPAGAKVEFRVLADDMDNFQGDYLLTPVGSPAENTDDSQGGTLAFSPDWRAYQSKSLYPTGSVVIAEEAWIRGQRIAKIDIYPFQYVPSEGQLVFHRHLLVEIKFIGVDSQPVGLAETEVSNNKARGLDNHQNDILQTILLNYEVAKSFNNKLNSSRSEQLFSSQHQTSTDPRYKIVVNKDGIYHVTYEALRSAGMDFDLVDPASFEMTNQGRPVAIDIIGDGDSFFEEDEYILFYGEKFTGDYLASQYPNEDDFYRTFYPQDAETGDYINWTPQFNATMLEKYTDDNVYWLSTGAISPLRMTSILGSPSSGLPVPQTYTTTVHAEQSKYWYSYNFTSEDTFYWDQIRDQSQTAHYYTTTIRAIPTEPFSVTIRGEIVAKMFNDDAGHQTDHHTLIWLNTTDTLIDDKLWYGKSRYHFDKLIDGSKIISGTNSLKIQAKFDAYPGQVTDWLYFDWFEIEYPRRYQAENNQLKFTRYESGTTWQYEVEGFIASTVDVFDITDPLIPQRIITPSLSITGTVAFTGTHTLTTTYYLAATNNFLIPESVSFYVPPGWITMTDGVDYIYITHPDFITATQDLADLRTLHSGLSTLVVDINDIYNEFLYGIYHPLAIKNFIAYTFENWQSPPEYALLVGDGHWNFKHNKFYFNKGATLLTYSYTPIYLPPNMAWVDPWQGEVDSDNLLVTITNTMTSAPGGIYTENDPLPDVKIGRLPVNSETEIYAFLDKLQSYEQKPKEKWQGHFLFIADNVPDGAGDFVALSNDIINQYITSGLIADRIYENDFDCPPGSPADDPYNPCPMVKSSIITETLNKDSVLIVNYVGHGDYDIWSNERIFTLWDISVLTNTDRLPLFLPMTCKDGIWSDPIRNGLQETLLRSTNKGSIAAFAATGLGIASGHDYLQKGFYDSLFVNDNWELGEATISARLRLWSGGDLYSLIHTFSLFGDPAMHILKPDRYFYLPIVNK